MDNSFLNGYNFTANPNKRNWFLGF